MPPSSCTELVRFPHPRFRLFPPISLFWYFSPQPCPEEAVKQYLFLFGVAGSLPLSYFLLLCKKPRCQFPMIQANFFQSPLSYHADWPQPERCFRFSFGKCLSTDFGLTPQLGLKSFAGAPSSGLGAIYFEPPFSFISLLSFHCAL